MAASRQPDDALSALRLDSSPAAMREEVNPVDTFTSLAALLSAPKREDGHTLTSEVIALVLVIFAILGAISLLGRLP
jgi:hypothetical protein